MFSLVFKKLKAFFFFVSIKLEKHGERVIWVKHCQTGTFHVSFMLIYLFSRRLVLPSIQIASVS